MTLVLLLTACIGCGSDWRDSDGDLFSPNDGDCDDDNPDVHPDAEEDWYNGVDENCDGNDGDQDGDGFVPDHYVEEFPDWPDWPAHDGSGDCWDDPEVIPGDVGGESEDDYCAQDSTDLIAGQHIDVGALTVSNSETHLVVEYQTEGGWLMTEAHLHVGCDDSDIPDNQGGPIPGQFDYSDSSSGTQSFTFEIPLTDIDCWQQCGQPLVLAAHASVELDDGTSVQQETAWGDGRDHVGKNWARLVDYTSECCEDDGDTGLGIGIDAFEVYPGAPDIWKDGVDADCGDDSDYDQDGDGHDCDDAAPDGTDCDDTDPDVHPGAEEVCNGKDDDCDGTIDANASDCTDFYADADGDGFGLDVDVMCLCEPDGDYTAEEGGDCDDNDPNAWPGADEVCDGVDNDCDGGVDNDAIDADTWYIDGDGDGVGDASVLSCDQPTNGVSEDGDCDDTDNTVYPGSTWTETPGDGIDQDCDGVDACSDLDCDGVADIVTTHFYDSQGSTYVGKGYIYSGASGWEDSTTFTARGGHRLLVEDLDGDGYKDLVVANHFDNSTFLTNSVVYWGGPGGPSNANKTNYPTAAAAWPVTGDFNGDGYTDLAFSNHHNNSSYVQDSIVFYGDGGGPNPNVFVELPTLGAYEALAEDLDGDGYDDLVFANTGDDSSYEVDSVIYWGSSSGLSSTDATDLPTTGAFSVVTADVNGDGYTDLAFSSYIDDDGSYALDSLVYLGSGSGYSPSDVLYLDTVGAYWVRAADLDGDGYDDLVLPSYYNGSFSLDSNVYWGSSSGPSNSNVTELPTKGAMEPLLEDMDQDGYVDIVFSNARSNSTYAVDSTIYWGGSSGYSSFDTTDLATTGAHGAAAGDLDGDGYLDLVFSNYLSSTGNRLMSPIYWGDSTWSASTSHDLYTVGNYAPPIIVQ